MRLWHDVRLLHTGANALLATTLAAMLVAGIVWMVKRPVFALRSVSIEAVPGHQLRHVSTQLLRVSAARRVNGNFFTVDLDAVRSGFETVPWVRRATVRRIWPNRLVVAIEEHSALALWGDGRLLNTFGELFSANLDEAEEDGPLPEFAGPAGSEHLVLSRYEELKRWLAPLARRPEAVLLSSRYAWSARLDDGTTLLLGREQGLPIEERVTRWASVYPRVQAKLDRRAEVIDLRYPNGFAVRSVAMVGSGGARTPPPVEAVVEVGHTQ
jgi:cell division protein FtsQ